MKCSHSLLPLFVILLLFIANAFMPAAVVDAVLLAFFFEKYLTFFNYIIKAPPPHFNGKIIKELRLEVSDLQKQNDILREEISRVKLEKDKLQREVSYRNTHNDILREQISQLKLEKDKLRANVMQNDSLAKKKYKLEEQLKHKR